MVGEHREATQQQCQTTSEYACCTTDYNVERACMCVCVYCSWTGARARRVCAALLVDKVIDCASSVTRDEKRDSRGGRRRPRPRGRGWGVRDRTARRSDATDGRLACGAYTTCGDGGGASCVSNRAADVDRATDGKRVPAAGGTADAVGIDQTIRGGETTPAGIVGRART